MAKVSLTSLAIIVSLTAMVFFQIPHVNSAVSSPYTYNEEVNEKDVLDLIKSIISNNAVFDVKQDNNGFIEPEIYDAIEKNGNAMVIVWLNGDLNSYDVDEIKKTVNNNQNMVLKALIDSKNNLEAHKGEVLDNQGNKLIKEDDSDLDENSINKNKEESFRLIYRYEVFNGFAGIINKKDLEILSKHELVKAVYLEKMLHPALAESVPLINANSVWAMQTSFGNVTGAGQTICVVDTGINYNHPSLGGCLGAGCKVKGGWDFINNDNDPMDDQGHGTHVAGIVAANGNIKGVAPGAELIAVKVCDNSGSAGSCPGSSMIAGVDYCVANINTLGTDLITISIGDGGEYGPNSNQCPSWINNNLNLATYLGIPITISSGNEAHNNGISYPACSQNVISVGATYDVNLTGSVAWNSCTDLSPRVDNVTCFSNTGANLDVMAPGAIINSTYFNGNYRVMGGTSMAAPHVAGTIALLKQLYPSLTPFQLENVLKKTGVRVIDFQNGLVFPRIDALKSVNYFAQGNDTRLTFNSGYSAGTTLRIDSQRNAHIAWRDNRNGNWEIYYTKLDNNGNTLVEDTRLTFDNGSSSNPSLKLDAQENIHITWNDARDSPPPYYSSSEIYYTKLDNNGNTLVEDTRLTFNNSSSSNPSLSMDFQDNIHIAWSDGRDGNAEIYYTKLDNNGNTLVDDTRLTFDVRNSNYPSLDLDTQGNAHVAWEDTRDNPIAYPNPEIYYKKLDNNGNMAINDTRLTFDVRNSNYPSLDLDTQGNVHIVWQDQRTYVYEIYYEKLDNNGNTLINDNMVTMANVFSGYPSLNVDTQGNAHITWDDARDGNREIYYEKLDNNGNTTVNDRRLTFNGGSSYKPSVGIDAQGSVHVAWEDNRDGNFEIYYKHLFYALPSIELIGTPAPGSTVSLQLNSPLNANQSYIFGLALGTSPGFNLGNHHVLLSPDFLLSATMSNPSSAGLSNSIGTLNANGQATVSLTIPNLPWLSGWTVYGGFIIFDSQGQISGISDPIQIDII